MIEDNIVMWKFQDGSDRAPLDHSATTNVFKDFTSWVKDENYKSPSLVRAEESRRSVELVLAMYESARTGLSIKLPLNS